MTSFHDRYGQYALVTGASGGIGEEFARQLAQRGLNLVLVARRQEKLAELAASLTASAKIDVKTVALDLVAENAVATLLKTTESLDIGLIVLNAGTLTMGPFLDGALQEHMNLVSLNVLVPMQLAHQFGNRLARRGRGGLLFVASIVGEHPTPYEANYAASKAYVSSLGQSLHCELSGSGIDVTVLAPGLVDTPMLQNAPADVTKTKLSVTGPEPVVKAALDALGKRVVVIPGVLNKLTDVTLKHVPRSAGVRIAGLILGRMLPASPTRQAEPSKSAAAHTPLD